MDFSIITGLPPWYGLVCIFAGILGAMLLYFRERKNEFPAWLNRLLGVIRFFIIAFTALLLLSPFVKITQRTAEKPIIVIAQDNSRSLVLGDDSAYYRNEYASAVNAMADALSEDYDVSLFTFGEEVEAVDGTRFDTLGFTEKYTDIHAVAAMMDVRYVNRNVGALLIASDGIFNKGLNPRYHAADISYPIYTLALGDTSVRSDVYFKRVLYNKIAFAGNDFPVEAIVNANKLAGSSIAISLSERGRVVETKQFAVDNDNFSRTLRFNATASEPGTHHYVLRVSSNKDEVTRDNNRYDIFVDVLKSKKKILILYQSPHPDVSALKEAISSNINYEVSDMPAADFNGLLNDYSLLILHQLPSRRGNDSKLIDQVNRSGLPVLYILGPQSRLSDVDRLDAGLRISQYNRAGVNEALPYFNEGFSLFLLSEGTRDLVSFLPPLNSPFARYEMANASGALFLQKIGSIVTEDPLWMFSGRRGTKKAVIAGTGIWKWRMRAWVETGGHKNFNELVNKSIQYLALSEDKRRFRVYAEENIDENTSVELNAELYNDSYEPYNDPEVNLVIRDEEGNTYNFLFNKSGDAYSLDAGSFPVGTYAYQATVNTGEEVLQDAGGFTVAPVIAEQVSLRADHDLLRALAVDQGGRMFYPSGIGAFPEVLNDRDDIKPLMHAERKYVEFIDIVWVLMLIVLLLATEWFLRKWSGSY